MKHHPHHHPHSSNDPTQAHPQAEQSPASQEPAAQAPAADAPAPAAPGELDAIRAERDNLLGRLQRLSADYLNYQKRVQKDIAHAHDFGNEALIKAMLSVLDDMDRALASAAGKPQDDPLVVGFKLVRDKTLESLKNFGLVEISSEGQPFDPEHHAAVLQQPSADVPPGTVLRELQKGYAVKGRTIRPATVIISKEPVEEKTE